MGHLAPPLVAKSHRASSMGKRGEQGRFVTLKSGRVIFIPAGQRTKWADVRDKVLASQKRGKKPLYESVKGMPVKSKRLGASQRGVETTFVNEYEDGTKVLVKQNFHGSAESELMAYEFSESIGWDIVPETIVPKTGRFADNESVQRWVEGETAAEMPPFGAEKEFRKNSRMLIMDTLLQNPDRHRNNILIDKEGKQWAIDNNMAFRAYAIWEPPAESGPFKARHEYDYSSIKGWAGRGVTRDRVGLIDAARDVASWHKTPAYRKYVEKLRETIGDDVARQFKENVRLMADWSERARVVE